MKKINEIRELIKDIKQEYGKVESLQKKYFNSPYNAKLYDLSYEIENILIKKEVKNIEENVTDIFYSFCNDMWLAFEDFLSDNNVKIEQWYRTSSFTIVNDVINSEMYDNNSMDAIISQVYNHGDYHLDNVLEAILKNKPLIDIINEMYINDTYMDIIDSFENLKDTLQFIFDEMNDVAKVIEGLENFKDNQVLIFTDWLNQEIECGYIDTIYSYLDCLERFEA